MASTEVRRFSSISVFFGKIREGADFGEHAHQLFERAHLFDLAELVAKILEGEIVFAELAFELAGFLFVDVLFGFFDQAEDVAHAENAGDDAVGIERLERVVFFADADEFYRRAGNFADGEGCAAASVAVELREDDTGDAEPFVKFAGGANGVLADHGVGDEENFRGIQFALQHLQFVHQFGVDVEAAGGVDEDHVVGGKLCFAHGAAHDFERLVGSGAGPERRAGGARDLGELFAGSGAIDVGGDDHRAVAMFGEPFAHFAGGGGFAGALQADDEPDRRRARAELRFRFAAEQVGELVAHDFYDLLIGRELQQNFLAEGLFADVGDEFVGDAEVYVAIEKRFANFGEAGVEMLVGELALAAQVLEGAL